MLDHYRTKDADRQSDLIWKISSSDILKNFQEIDPGKVQFH